MVKDRLGELKKKRLYGSFRGSFRSSCRRVLKPQSPTDEEQVLAHTKEIQSSLNLMQQLVTDLQQLYSDAVTSPFAASKSMEKAENLNADIRRHAVETNRKLSKLDMRTLGGNACKASGNLLTVPAGDASNGGPALEEEAATGEEPEFGRSPAARRLCGTHYVLLLMQLTSIMGELNTAEVTFRDNSRRGLKRQMSIAGSRMTAAELEDKVDDNLMGNFAVFTQGIVTDVVDVEAASMHKDEVKDAMACQHAMLSLEKSIKEMHTIFQDVAIMMGRQGEVVDSIQCHAQKTASFVEHGKNDLAKAAKSKKGHAKFKVISVVVAIALLVIIFFVVLLTMLLT